MKELTLQKYVAKCFYDGRCVAEMVIHPHKHWPCRFMIERVDNIVRGNGELVEIRRLGYQTTHLFPIDKIICFNVLDSDWWGEYNTAALCN